MYLQFYIHLKCLRSLLSQIYHISLKYLVQQALAIFLYITLKLRITLFLHVTLKYLVQLVTGNIFITTYSVFWVHICRTYSSLINMTTAVQIPGPLNSQLRRRIKPVNILGILLLFFFFSNCPRYCIYIT